MTVEDLSAQRKNTPLPMAPRLQRSMGSPAPRSAPPQRRRSRRGFYVFMLAQFLIAIVAFVFVRDYMSNGYIKNALANVLSQATRPSTENGKLKTDQVVAVAVKPPPVSGAETEQDAELNQEIPKVVEPEPALPAETQITAIPAVLKPAPQIKVEVVPQLDEPVPQAEVQAATPPVEPEPAPQIEEQATEAVPDLTLLKGVPDAAAQPELSDSQQKEGLIFRDCDYCPELVSVAPGQYMVGSGGVGVAQPSLGAAEAKEVIVSAPFAIGRYEITFEDWERCVSAGGCNSPPSDDGWGRGRRPVIHVSYNDITEQYLPWLSKVTGYTYRLPTEAEWELASQGGNKSSQGQTLEAAAKAQVACSYGNSSDVAAKTRESIWAGVGCNDGFLYSAPAGSLSANSLGIFDMHGNVWEWVSDCWHATYASEEEKNSPVCKYHVLRGGSWASEFRFLPDGVWVGDAVAYRAAVRGWETSIKARNSIGFRVARSQS